MKKIKELLLLFITFLKIGLFTFGGGYAMVAVLQNELVEKKKWVEKNDFLDIIAIAESTPGPIAINSATFIGYKRNKFIGSFIATLGFVIPSFVIILVISFFIDEFDLLSISYVNFAFKGINSCVAFLILSAGIKMFIKQKKSIFNLVMYSLTVIVFVLFAIFSIEFSSVYFILIGGFVGLICYFLSSINDIKKIKKEKK